MVSIFSSWRSRNGSQHSIWNPSIVEPFHLWRFKGRQLDWRSGASSVIDLTCNLEARIVSSDYFLAEIGQWAWHLVRNTNFVSSERVQKYFTVVVDFVDVQSIRGKH